MTEDPPSEVAELTARAARFRLVVFGLAVVALVAVAAGVGPDVQTIRGWTAAAGWIAPVVFVLLYAGLTVVLVPGSVLTLAAGLLFGAGIGSVVAVVGATIGATIAFVLARTAGRRAVERLISGRAARVDRWLGDRGLLSVVTLRIVPLVPFAISNYAAGLTAVRLRDFVIGTALGIVPGAVAYTVLGANVADPTDPAFVGAIAALVVLAVAGGVRLRTAGGDERRRVASQPSEERS
ncbi:MAG: TVP38/TMEM64 family protein [Actinobacteria bacterium]|nr:TVP38/TMEM64 family protein [Actinomycetota bacterium]